jgi:hypothetical protein
MCIATRVCLLAGLFILVLTLHLPIASVLDTLPYARGASWDPSLCCLDQTRAGLLENIWNWINNVDASSTAQIFCLADVAGAGKSAVAHTVARRCHEQGWLASSFFFDRATAGRNGTQMLFSTIASDLANFDVGLATQITQALKRDRSLASAPILRQFEELILTPSKSYSGKHPAVIVIDALDEGSDSDAFLSILGYGLPKLPANFRFFVTMRPEAEIVHYLSRQAHIRYEAINVHEAANQADITVYALSRLRDIGKRRELPVDWPDEQLLKDFLEKAEGLFMWVATVAHHLSGYHDPDKQLRRMLSNGSLSNIASEDKMDELYTTILMSCNWRDEDFVRDYQLVMGAIIAAKTPLSASALQSLHRTTPKLQVGKVLSLLGSVLTGVTGLSQRPICALHLSFREFLTIRAHSMPGRLQFHIDTKEHSARLAFLCLVVLTEGFAKGIPGLGYSTKTSDQLNGFPDFRQIPEELWYACMFWQDHLVDVPAPVPGLLVECLRKFLSAYLVSWVEVVIAKGRFQKIRKTREWLQVCLFTVFLQKSDTIFVFRGCYRKNLMRLVIFSMRKSPRRFCHSLVVCQMPIAERNV